MMTQMFFLLLAVLASGAASKNDDNINLGSDKIPQLNLGEEELRTSDQIYGVKDEPKSNHPLDKKIREGRVFFAFYSQTSVTILTTTTLNAISTCISTFAGLNNIGQTPCVGRKRRRTFEESFLEKEDDTMTDPIDSSLDEIPVENQERGKIGKKLTLWSTSFSTLTVTTTSFISGTTATVSLACLIAGNLAAPVCVG